MREDNRPDPNRLLRQLKQEEVKQEQTQRGKLRIFLGFAAGVGKTYAMLESAHTLLKQGVDVAAGYIEPHARPETRALQNGIEQIPLMELQYKGMLLKEFNLDAALIRRPAVLLVDELAHSNAEGCRHQKRYQDIEELLQAGIHVYTTMNIQHLESLNDQIASITGIQVRERVPDWVFDHADQVEIVDIEPDDLILRLKEGKIYGENQAQRAITNFFTPEKLVALREIALRRMADRVNRLAIEEQQRSDREYYVGEHILTCVSASPTNAKVIRTAARLAYAFHGELTALYVETPVTQSADPGTKKRLEENMQLARSLGARISTVFGEDVPYQIAEYAKVSNVSKIVIGRTNHRIYFGQTRGTLVERLTQYAPNLDVYIIPDIQHSLYNKKLFHIQKETITVNQLLKTALILAACSAMGLVFRRFSMADSNIIMVYILGVLLCSIYTDGRLCSLAASILSVILYNYLFTVPYYSLKAYGAGYPVTFLVMFLVGMVTSSLTVRLRRQNKDSSKKAYRTELLLNNSRRLRRADSVDAVIDEIADQILKLLNLPVIFYLKDGSALSSPHLFPRKGMSASDMSGYCGSSEEAVVQWVFQNHHRAGACTSTLPSSKAIYLPLQDHEEVLAVVGIVLEQRREIAPFEYGILTAMLDETALVLERILKGRRR